MGNVRNYPVKKPTSAPGTGKLLVDLLFRRIKVPASASHRIWHGRVKDQLEHPDESAFRGHYPLGETLRLRSLGGKPVKSNVPADSDSGEKGTVLYEFRGDEVDAVYVSDLAPSEVARLGIPAYAEAGDKVFNPNYVEYEDLPEITRLSNELASLALPKALGTWFGSRGNLTYSEIDIFRFLDAVFRDLNSPESLHLLSTNHVLWTALSFVRSKGTVTDDLIRNFFAQQAPDFYAKDVGTILPAAFYALALLGLDPVEYNTILEEHVSIWGTRDCAVYMRQFMHEDVRPILEVAANGESSVA